MSHEGKQRFRCVVEQQEVFIPDEAKWKLGFQVPLGTFLAIHWVPLQKAHSYLSSRNILGAVFVSVHVRCSTCNLEWGNMGLWRLKLEVRWCLLQADVQVSASCFFHLILWCGKVKWWNGLWVKPRNGEDSFSAYFDIFLPRSLCFDGFSKEFQHSVCVHFPGMVVLRTRPAASRGQPKPLDTSETAHPDFWVFTKAAWILMGAEAPWTVLL